MKEGEGGGKRDRRGKLVTVEAMEVNACLVLAGRSPGKDQRHVEVGVLRYPSLNSLLFRCLA